MPNSQYYAATLLYYGIILVGAILIKDVSTIFGFVGSFSGAGLGFIMPGMMYMKANTLFPENRDVKNSKLGVIGGNPDSNKLLLYTAYI